MCAIRKILYPQLFLLRFWETYDMLGQRETTSHGFWVGSEPGKLE